MSDFGSWFYPVKTRKPHLCIFCERIIPKETKALHSSGMLEGDWQNWYCCNPCRDNGVTKITDGYVSGDEFNLWAENQEWYRCPKCGNFPIKKKWSKSGKTIEYECNCGNKWTKFIGF